jgi:hypothetical protein
MDLFLSVMILYKTNVALTARIYQSATHLEIKNISTLPVVSVVIQTCLIILYETWSEIMLNAVMTRVCVLRDDQVLVRILIIELAAWRVNHRIDYMGEFSPTFRSLNRSKNYNAKKVSP